MCSTAVKRCARLVVCAIFAAILCFLSACGSQPFQKQTGIKVSVADSVFFTSSKSAATVDKGDDFTVTLNMHYGYYPVSCDYEDYELERVSMSEYRLTLKDIKRPARVNVASLREEAPLTNNPEKTCSITYYINDGTSDVQTVDYTLSYHIRPNTLSGEGIERDGYTLLGWNTKEDGSGEHIGLGSRVTVEDGGSLTLYGEWVQWLPEDDFFYSTQADGTVALTAYRGSGDMEMFVVPGMVDGYVVTGISSSFTTNIPCGSITSKVLVLPSSVTEVKGNAFGNADFEEIYFCDSLETVSPSAFSNNITTYHVNAVAPPRLQNGNYNARYADNLDIIISNSNKKKLILFSGCSLCYGLNSGAVALNFKDYVVVNAGLNGEFDALFQLECMLPYIREGDVLVHAPEQKNPYQFLIDNALDGRVFAMVEGNYDLLTAADFSYTDTVFDAWAMYKNLRSKGEDCSYDDHTGLFNNYGDIIVERPYDESNEIARDVAYTEGWGFDPGLLNKGNIDILAGVYDMFSDRGAEVYFSWAPINEQSDGNRNIRDVAQSFEKQLAELLAPHGYRIISSATDYIYKGRYFYDTDYHLNDMGVALRTEQLIEDMKKAGI